jgi:hypothetical protein
MVECVALDRFRSANSQCGDQGVQILLLLRCDVVLGSRSGRIGLKRKGFVVGRSWIPSG